MTLHRTVSAWALFLLALLPAVAAKPVPAPDRWVSTWATAPVAGETQDLAGLGTGELTLRQLVHVSLGGPLVRVTLTNEHGTEPLRVNAVHLALAAGGSSIQLASANRMTFHGADAITIPPGAVALSDPAALVVPAGAMLAITLNLPAQPVAHTTFHRDAHQTSYAVAGNRVGAGTLKGAATIGSWYFLKSMDVKLPGDTGVIVAFGDSITDGTASTQDANARWTDVLAARLGKRKATRTLAVVNEGIAGNRLLHDGAGRGASSGPSALARFDRDVLALPGVRYLVVLEGINDIGVASGPQFRADPETAETLIQAWQQLLERAHAHSIRVIGATLTPYAGAAYASPEGEALRKQVNGWLRANKELDGLIDFDDATRDAHDPDRFRPAYDSGDHLHPNDAGYRAMGDAVDLNLFAAK